MSAPKVVRTTVITVRDHNDDTDVGVARMLGDDGYEPGDPVVILPAVSFDRMVERERAAMELLDVLSGMQIEQTEIGRMWCNACDGHWKRGTPERHEDDEDCPVLRARAFLAETKGSNDGK